MRARKLDWSVIKGLPRKEDNNKKKAGKNSLVLFLAPASYSAPSHSRISAAAACVACTGSALRRHELAVVETTAGGPSQKNNNMAVSPCWQRILCATSLFFSFSLFFSSPPSLNLLSWVKGGVVRGGLLLLAYWSSRFTLIPESRPWAPCPPPP